MDTFFEQIISIKKKGTQVLLTLGIWLLATVLSCLIVMFLGLGMIVLGLTLSGFVFYGAFKLSQLFSVEYEYIVTNTSFDIDKIVAKSSRKRMVSIEIPNVTSIEKYNPNAPKPNGCEKYIIACNGNEENAYNVVAQSVKGGKVCFVFAPNERVIEGMTKTLPKYIANSAFKK